MKFYAVIDTNVLVSGIMYKESIPGMVISQALGGRIVPLFNSKIIDEYNDVLRRPKFKFNEGAVELIVDGILSRGICIEERHIDEYFPDPKDAVFYEVVMEAKNDYEAYLITGNLKHFPVKPFVITARDMLNIIFSE